MDVLRGFALLGISVVNTVEIVGPSAAGDGFVYWAYKVLLRQRFFPIFSFLFGFSFGLFLSSVRERARGPRLVMVARLGFLIPIGALHRVLQPQEVLLTYAVVGIVVLLPASFLDGRVVLALGGAAAVAAVLVGGGGVLVPGLFLVGLGVQKCGVLESGGRLVVFGGLLVAAVALDVLQIGAGSRVGAAAGVVTAAAYVSGILWLLRSPARHVLLTLAPLGRMALTCYVGATLMILLAGQVVENPGFGVAVLLGVSVFVVQLAFSSLWQRHARYGPLEWVWRCLTWWEFVPMRATSTAG